MADVLHHAGSGPAQPAPTAVTATGAERYLTFRLGEEVFALPILDITEIIEYSSLTAVPMMPPFIRGVLNLRGLVVPVVDLAARFGRPSTRLGRRSSIIIVETDVTGSDQHYGIIVDAVNEVIHLHGDDLQPPPQFGAGIRAEYICGMAQRNNDFTIVLDVGRVLTQDELDHLDQLTSAEPEAGQPVGLP
jgi:purine-binding chemotaxis protein CheW